MTKFLSHETSQLLRHHFGDERFTADPQVLEGYSHDTTAFSVAPAAVVFPCAAVEVQTLVRIANQHRLELYPISQGKNWGYGAAMPAKSGSIVVDLRRMNKIVQINQRDAYCIIEPGVTQGQLSEYLDLFHPQLMMDVTGSAYSSSIVGNILDRGFGATHLADRANNTLGFEVVLADGSIIRTGFARFENSLIQYAYPHGIGPSLTGIFMQSNLGIVTKAAVALVPKPERFAIFIFAVRRQEQLLEIFDAYKHCVLNTSLRASLKVGNLWRTLSLGERFPWDEAQSVDGAFRISREKEADLIKYHRLTPWTGMLTVCSSREEFSVQSRLGRRLLSAADRITYVSDKRLAVVRMIVKRWPKLLPARLRIRLSAMLASAELSIGRPTDFFMRTVYWRSRSPLPSGECDPIRDGAGFYWISPVIPSDPTHIGNYISLIEEIFDKFGFEPQITLNQFSARYIISVVTLCYDKQSISERERAHQCYNELMERQINAGYYPYRIEPHFLQAINAQGSASYNNLLRSIKSALDPGEILSPGRYIPASDSCS